MGAVHCIHAALPHLKTVRGMIVNCPTAQALIGFSNHSGYVASKHAIHGFLDTLDMEQEGSIQFLEVIIVVNFKVFTREVWYQTSVVVRDCDKKIHEFCATSKHGLLQGTSGDSVDEKHSCSDDHRDVRPKSHILSLPLTVSGRNQNK